MFENIKMNKAKRILKKRIIIMLDRGASKEEIIKKAGKVGWKKGIIDGIFEQLEEKKKDETEIKVKIPFLKKKIKEEEVKEEPEKPEEEPEEKEEQPKKGLV